ncbi:MAG: hypothetical protein IPL24_18500 [Bacteroidetes bacterium]|nr:hypothetical protein [Bacteroidota bacterium]
MFYSLPAKASRDNIRGMYVDSTSSWLEIVPLKIRYSGMQLHDLNYMTLYDLNNLSWTKSTNIAKLAVFISKAKTQYRII